MMSASRVSQSCMRELILRSCIKMHGFTDFSYFTPVLQKKDFSEAAQLPRFGPGDSRSATDSPALTVHH